METLINCLICASGGGIVPLSVERGESPMKQFKIVVEKHPDAYVAYPLGVKGVVVGQGETYEAAVADVKSAIQFHLETFGPETLKVDPPVPSSPNREYPGMTFSGPITPE